MRERSWIGVAPTDEFRQGNEVWERLHGHGHQVAMVVQCHVVGTWDHFQIGTSPDLSQVLLADQDLAQLEHVGDLDHSRVNRIDEGFGLQDGEHGFRISVEGNGDRGRERVSAGESIGPGRRCSPRWLARSDAGLGQCEGDGRIKSRKLKCLMACLYIMVP